MPDSPKNFIDNHKRPEKGVNRHGEDSLVRLQKTSKSEADTTSISGEAPTLCGGEFYEGKEAQERFLEAAKLLFPQQPEQ